MSPQKHQQHDTANGASRLLRGDSLGTSMMLLVGLVGLQRLIGLVRNVAFCRLLTDDQLGRWSLSYNFLLLAAPLVVFGVPGSFGRYVEHYRQRGQLRAFLRRTSMASLAAALVAAAAFFALPRAVAVLVYDDPSQVHSVRLLSVVLVSVVAFNFLIELLTALRLVRVVALMQLASSMAFALAGLGLLCCTRLAEHAAVMAFGAGYVVTTFLGLYVVWRVYRGLPGPESPLASGLLWRKLLPFAAWIWVGNLIANLFAVSDQFLLKHFSRLPPEAADALVGQYYSSRVVPLLMAGVVSLLASSLLPFLTEDWEAGRADVARKRINTSLKLFAVLLTAGGAAALVAAPLLFQGVLGGKYDAGLSVLPGTLTYCIWYSLYCVAYSYLLCVEKAWLGSLSLLAGLAVSVVLNILLAPRLGLPGVVWAAMAANACALGLVYHFSHRAGMTWDRGVWLASLLPLTLCLGGWAALAVLVAVLIGGWPAGWVFDNGEAQRAQQAAVIWCSRILRAAEEHPRVSP